jgi:photosystem II stability/assembly factor-like uncharacterized protein
MRVLVVALFLVPPTLTVATQEAGFSVFSVGGNRLLSFASQKSLSSWEPLIVHLPFAVNLFSTAAVSEQGVFVATNVTVVAFHNGSAFVAARMPCSAPRCLFSSVISIPGTKVRCCFCTWDDPNCAFTHHYMKSTKQRVAVVIVKPQTTALLLSDDGGRTWSWTADLPDNGEVGLGSFPIIAFSSRFGLLCHRMRYPRSTFYRSLDGGKTWSIVPFHQPTLTITQIAVINATHAIATGYPSLSSPVSGMMSSDAGATWFPLNMPPGSGTPWSPEVMAIAVIDSSTWAVATSVGQVWRTADSAATWELVYGNASLGVTFDGLAYVPEWNALLAKGAGGNVPVVVSFDGGKRGTWQTLDAGPFGGLALGCVVGSSVPHTGV